MGLILTLLLAAFVGWVASMIMGTDYEMGAIENIVAGLVGGFIGNLLFGWIAPASPTDNGLSLMGLVIGVIGACIAIAVWRSIRR